MNLLKHALLSTLIYLNCNDIRTNRATNYILPHLVPKNKTTLSLLNQFNQKIILNEII